jgi:low affinity Fe/Cu permease
MQLIRRAVAHTPQIVGSPYAFLLASCFVFGWAVGGLVFGFTDTWLLWPSAVASIVTFLIAFSLQYTVNRDTRAIQLKLDEILRAHAEARSELIKLEQLEDSHLQRMEAEIVQSRDEAAG